MGGPGLKSRDGRMECQVWAYEGEGDDGFEAVCGHFPEGVLQESGAGALSVREVSLGDARVIKAMVGSLRSMG